MGVETTFNVKMKVFGISFLVFPVFGTDLCGSLPSVIARDVTTIDISATIFDENFEIQTGVFQFEDICDGCYAIVCQTGHVIRRYPQKHNVPVISCHDGRWKFENPRKAGVLESATSSQNVLKSKCEQEF